MYVACSTLCFGRRSLEDALAVIVELKFNKFDVAIHEAGRQLRPSEVLADVAHTAARLRHNPGLSPCAFSVEFGVAVSSEEDDATITTSPATTIPIRIAAPSPRADTRRPSQSGQRSSRLDRCRGSAADSARSPGYHDPDR